MSICTPIASSHGTFKSADSRYGLAVPGHFCVKSDLPLSPSNRRLVERSRDDVANIMRGNDPRTLIVVGPCAVYDPGATVEYAQRLSAFANLMREKFLIVMRVYAEKPRTGPGWKGMLSDPDLDGSHDLEKGLRSTRKLMLDVLDTGMPIATEVLDIDHDLPRYFDDAVTWSCIGARTTTSQPHRQFASGARCPVGFKNSPAGSFNRTVDDAVNGILVGQDKAILLGRNEFGQICRTELAGNPDCHLVLRGTEDGPNCDIASIEAATARLRARGIQTNIMVDCNHDNSGKDFRLQARTFATLIRAIRDGSGSAIKGIMIESDLEEGSQKMHPAEQRKRGISVTDPCLGLSDTIYLLLAGHRALTGKPISFPSMISSETQRVA